MSLRCRWGIHRWLKKKATLRPSRVVRRCQRCGTINVKQVKTKLLPRPN